MSDDAAAPSAKREARGPAHAPEAAAFQVFKPNQMHPREELLPVLPNLTESRRFRMRCLWDLKEVLFFAIAVAGWIAERYDTLRETGRKPRVEFLFGSFALGGILLIDAFHTYFEMARRERAYYSYLRLEIVIDFDNVLVSHSGRFIFVVVTSAYLYYVGCNADDPLAYHNLDGFIFLFSLIYFYAAVLRLEDRLLPFNRFAENATVCRIMRTGWTQLLVVREAVIVKYVLLRMQQVREYERRAQLAQLQKMRRLVGNRELATLVYPQWLVSRADIVHFIHHELHPTNNVDTDAASLISGFWWRKHFWGTMLGTILIGTNAAYDDKDVYRGNLFTEELRTSYQSSSCCFRHCALVRYFCGCCACCRGRPLADSSSSTELAEVAIAPSETASEPAAPQDSSTKVAASDEAAQEQAQQGDEHTRDAESNSEPKAKAKRKKMSAAAERPQPRAAAAAANRKPKPRASSTGHSKSASVDSATSESSQNSRLDLKWSRRQSGEL